MTRGEFVTFEEWESEVPNAIKEDSLWKVEAYRLGLFLSDLTWHDCGRLLKTGGAAVTRIRFAALLATSVQM